MPDHLHIVVEGANDESDMARFVKAFKQVTAFRYKAETGGRLWQKKYYDHVLRALDSLDAVLGYVWMNPVRTGLCADWREYPHSGSFTMEWNGRAMDEKGWTPPWKDQTSNRTG